MQSQLILALCVLLLTNAPTAIESKSDHFKLSYSIHIDGNGKTKVWVPIAHNSPVQQVRVELPKNVSTYPGVHGNEFGFAEVNAPAELTVHYDVTREQQGALRADGQDFQQWLQADNLIPLDMTARNLAQKLTASLPDKASNSQKGRAIYDYVVSSMKYDKSGQGWGRGDFLYACNALKGNCTDFHSLFIGLCRAAGVPARFTIGLSVPDGTKGKIEGYHCWAEFYDPVVGWVPVDASIASQTQKREFYFGTLDPHRVAFTVGRDIVLHPAQAGEPLNYMIYAYAERDGKLVPTKTTITFER